MAEEETPVSNPETQPADFPSEHPAHPVAEDPEEHIGDELPDPWDDTDENGQWKEMSA